MSELISVIMPVYRPNSLFLSLAIASVLEQSHSNLELIILEDKSALTNEKTVKDFNDPRIHYILTQNNFANLVNQGLALSNGEFIARMDADDICEKDRLEKQLDFLLKNPDIGLVGSNLTIINETGQIIGQRFYPTNSLKIAQAMRLRNSLAHPTVLMRKKDLIAVGAYNQEFDTLADYDLWARWIGAGLKFSNLPEKLLRYRMHTGATKSYRLKKQLQDTLNIKKKYFRFKKGWTWFAETRYCLEKILLFLPSKFVYWLFIKINIK